jgi:hypothetical protein
MADFGRGDFPGRAGPGEFVPDDGERPARVTSPNALSRGFRALSNDHVAVVNPVPPDGDAPREPVRPVKAPEAGGDSGTGGGGGGQARQDAEDAKAALAQARGDLYRLRDELTDQWERLDRLIARVDAQIAGVDEVLQAGPGQGPGQAFRLTAGQAALADDVEETEESAQGRGGTLWKTIGDWLKKAGIKIWAMISQLVKIKEWTLAGTVGTGLLGLAEASISVTFG